LVNPGVPQGSGVGRLLFLLCINDVPTVSAKNAKLVLYADYASLIITSSVPIEFTAKLNNFLADVHNWFKSNLLSLNVNKSTYLQFLSKNSPKLDSISHR
jgi:hypothetical protein